MKTQIPILDFNLPRTNARALRKAVEQNEGVRIISTVFEQTKDGASWTLFNIEYSYPNKLFYLGWCFQMER